MKRLCSWRSQLTFCLILADKKVIDLVFLPSYSPKLNLVERLWHFFKKKVTYNTYHENIEAFRNACIRFFRNIDRHENKISNFTNAEFYLE